jgi:septum formation protein
MTEFAEGAQTRKLQLSPARLAPSVVDSTLLDMALLSVRLVTYVEKDSITLRMHQQNKPELILASSSPRRQELLREIGISFRVHAANINEDQTEGETPIAYALRVAREKARAVAVHYPQSYVLGADTIVVVDDEVLGKPKDRRDALRMLRLLSGRGHEVTTAVSVVAPGTLAPGTVATATVVPDALAETRASTTKVYFREIAEDEIQRYVAGGEPMDKAGAYAIQGGASRWADRIEGEFSNVVGLPLSLVTEMLITTGLINR